MKRYKVTIEFNTDATLDDVQNVAADMRYQLETLEEEEVQAKVDDISWDVEEIS